VCAGLNETAAEHRFNKRMEQVEAEIRQQQI
jgi:hypothetical protein